ncbi:toprim domain-containing protein [Mesorhizobium sp.]|uniref:toprim domain-containing protein n=1 Tax=Mesorhizobium sp. TaxID=1871066 RepID=UPI000FEA4778|nr:toprim domain-containing protein [Mesorhizobium sp.]RWB26913.1 MAG: hypothetical protein EOQ43_29140 [Mesorhizobium sp.]
MEAAIDLRSLEAIIAKLSPEDRAELVEQVAAELDKPFLPNPGPQTAALESLADILLYGGQAGGGKSALEVGAAANEHFSSLILRREATQLDGLIEFSREILAEHGDFVDRYLASRGIQQEAYPRWLRKHESIEHKTEDGARNWHPAMVAKIVAPDGSPTNLHRTYLTLDGRKAGVTPVRKTMWGAIAPGSAIRLFEAGPVLGVAEGIETALSAAELFRIPVWATVNTTILAGWQPPEGTHQVIIFGDNDPKYGGQLAALTLAHRLACDTVRNLSVRIEMPPRVGEDWNDVLIQKRKIAA